MSSFKLVLNLALYFLLFFSSPFVFGNSSSCSINTIENNRIVNKPCTTSELTPDDNIELMLKKYPNLSKVDILEAYAGKKITYYDREEVLDESVFDFSTIVQRKKAVLGHENGNFIVTYKKWPLEEKFSASPFLLFISLFITFIYLNLVISIHKNGDNW